MTQIYHIAARMVPLQLGEDGLAHVIIPDVPDDVDVIIGETSVNEYGGFVTLTFVKVDDVEEDAPTKPKLEVVTD